MTPTSNARLPTGRPVGLKKEGQSRWWAGGRGVIAVMVIMIMWVMTANVVPQRGGRNISSPRDYLIDNAEKHTL